MPRKLLIGNYTKAPLAIACMGDSLTENTVWNVPVGSMWPGLVGAALAATGCSVRVRSWGIAGDTTPGMVERFGVMTQYEVPAVACLWGGTNDQANSTSVAALTCSGTTAALTTTRAHGVANGASVTVSGATPAGYNGTFAATVTGPRSLTYTVGSTLAAGSGTILAASPLTTAQTQANLSSMIATLRAAGCNRVVVIGQAYQNIVGGDTVTAKYAPYDDVTGIRSAQIGAVTAAGPGVVYADLYGAMKARIVAGIDVQNSASWHVTPTNTHLNAYGNLICAGVVQAAIVAQGWDVAALK